MNTKMNKFVTAVAAVLMVGATYAGQVFWSFGNLQPASSGEQDVTTYRAYLIKDGDYPQSSVTADTFADAIDRAVAEASVVKQSTTSLAGKLVTSFADDDSSAGDEVSYYTIVINGVSVDEATGYVVTSVKTGVVTSYGVLTLAFGSLSDGSAASWTEVGGSGGGETPAVTVETVAVTANAKDNTTVGGVYTNGVAIAATEDGTYTVEKGATVDVVFNTDTGYYFESADAIYGYTTTLTNEIEASEDTEVAGSTPVAGTQVGDSAYLVMKDGVCTILGTGATWSDKRIGNFVDRNTVTSVVIADGVTEITQRFFKECYFLSSVTGGKDLTTLGKNAFYLCMRLETINLDCTAIPAGLDESVVYRTAINSNSGAGYTIPAITVANHQRMLRGKKTLADAEWTDLGSPEGQNLFETGYNFFKIDLVEIAADVNGSEDATAGIDIAMIDEDTDGSRDGSDAPAWGEFD